MKPRRLNPIELSIRQRERWIQSVQRERDLTARQLKTPLRRRDDEDREALQDRLKMLDLELANVKAEVDQLLPLRDTPASLFGVRPARQWPPLPSAAAMAKAEIQAERKRRPKSA